MGPMVKAWEREGFRNSLLGQVIFHSLITATQSELDKHSHLLLGLVLHRSSCQKGCCLCVWVLVDLIKERALLVSKGRREPKPVEGLLTLKPPAHGSGPAWLEHCWHLLLVYTLCWGAGLNPGCCGVHRLQKAMTAWPPGPPKSPQDEWVEMTLGAGWQNQTRISTEDTGPLATIPISMASLVPLILDPDDSGAHLLCARKYHFFRATPTWIPESPT